MKKLLQTLFIVILIFIALVFAKNAIAKILIEKGVELATGLSLHIRSFSFNLLGKSDIHIQDFELENPRGFKDKVMMDLPEIYVDYDLGELLNRKIHIEQMRIHVREFVVEKNERGELNLDALKPTRSGASQPPCRQQRRRRSATLLCFV